MSPDEPLSLEHYKYFASMRPRVEQAVRMEMQQSIERSGSADSSRKQKSTVKAVRVTRKTFFSYNLKKFYSCKEPSDLLRMRLDSGFKDSLEDLGSILYSKDLMTLRSSSDQAQKYGEKIVYEVFRNIKLEVQFVEPGAPQLSSKMHGRYKLDKLAKAPGVKNISVCCLLCLLLKSIWFESVRGSFRRVAEDIRLFFAAVRVRQFTNRVTEA